MANEKGKEKKTKNKELKEKLFQEKKSAWPNFKNHKKVFGFAESYKKFIEKSKTERLCIENIKSTLVKNGFRDMDNLKKLKKGDKVYRVIKDKSLVAAVVGQNPENLKIVGSHIDSPRLDFKPSPMYEDSELALLKTHYYGGIKKYHWVNVPLSLHGIIHTKGGKKIQLQIGENENEPKFIISDLLIHLSREQLKKEASKVVEGEEMNVFFGNCPVDDDELNEKIKFNVLKKLYEDYGIIEEDFNFAELQFVPALKPIDIGIDKSMIGAYGHDDRACAYATMEALLGSKPHNTALALFVDKEEIGSVGNTGAESFLLQNFINDYAFLAGCSKDILRSADSISADGTCAMDPSHKDVFDARNTNYIGKGVSVDKYGGSGGKYHTNDAHAEYMQKIRTILEKNSIPWQTGEIGKIDMGGGGTIAMFLSRYGMDCVDAGPCILGMHSTCEVISKADLYCSYLLYRGFFEQKK
ncbi:MAG: aminopeptidase [Nanoarchaeota archaeon]